MTDNALTTGMPAAQDIWNQGRQAPAPLVRPGMSRSDMREAAQGFEAFFLSQMLSHMFAGLEADPLFGGGHGEEVWKSLMIDEYAKATARKGGIGIADHVMTVMLQAQEAADSPATPEAAGAKQPVVEENR